MNEPWEDYNLEFVESERVKVTWRTSPNQKTHSVSVLLPYNKESNHDLYRQIIANLKWLRIVFKNPSCNDKGFIVKRSRHYANSLDAWSDAKEELEGLLDIVRQVVAFKQYSPFDAKSITTRYCRTATASYNGANYIAKDEDNQSYLIKLNAILDVKNFVYPSRMDETVTFVSCGDPQNTHVAITSLLNANQKILSGAAEREALESSVAEALEWKTRLIETESGIVTHPYAVEEAKATPPPPPTAAGTGSFADAVRASAEDAPPEERTTVMLFERTSPSSRSKSTDPVTQAARESPPPSSPTPLQPLMPAVAQARPLGAAQYARGTSYPTYVTWDAFMHAMAEQKMHFEMRLARLEAMVLGNPYAPRSTPSFHASAFNVPGFTDPHAGVMPHLMTPPGFSSGGAHQNHHGASTGSMTHKFTGLAVSPHGATTNLF